MVKHNILVKYIEDEKSGNVKYTYKDLIKSKSGKYRMHKERYDFKRRVGELYLKYEALQYSLNCLYHDAITDKKVKTKDEILIYTNMEYIQMLNEAQQGKRAYAGLKDIKDATVRKYLISLIKTIQKIYSKTKIQILFKSTSKEYDNIFDSIKKHYREKTYSYILSSVKNISEEEASERRERFKEAFKTKFYDISDFIT